MPSVLVKFPTRARPQLFWESLSRWQADPLPRFLVTCDMDDPTMFNKATGERFARDPRVDVRYGHSKSKIEAINDGVKEAKFDLLVLGADDMIPQRADYAQRIVELFQHHFPNGDGVLHLNDGRAGRTLNTLPILDRAYLDRTGWIYCPRYQSLFADDEFQAVSESLGRSVYVDEVLIKHEWIGEIAPDELHYRNECFYDSDGQLFRERQAAGFP